MDMFQVDKKIYKARNVVKGSVYHRACREDLISVIDAPLRHAGYYLGYDGIYRRILPTSAVGVDTPWHHVKHLATKRCLIDHGLKFTYFNYVPPRCMECWKVVVAPRTIKELFTLLDIEIDLGFASKCGIELRYYTPRLYGGYFYANSMPEGRAIYERVRKAVDEHLSPDVGVILKRGCTEYEMVIGPSVAWFLTDEQHELDTRLESIIDMSAPSVPGQNSAALAQVHHHWIEWAWKHADPTVMEYLGGEALYPACMTYHEGDIDAVRMDMIRAKAMSKYGIEPETVNSIVASIRGFTMTKRVGPKEMAAVLGLDAINPLFVGEGTLC